MRKKAYGGTRVNDVDLAKMVAAREGQAVSVGIDVGKHKLFGVCRWADGRFERPWKVSNPQEIVDLVRMLGQLGAGRALVVAMESSGTYGDALRQALADAQIELQRVSGKAAHDYAEVFDGVPSQHDGKDAAVVAELAALGKSMPWSYTAASAWEQELHYWVDWMVAQRRVLAMWQGRLEGLLGRHWPEATRVWKLSSVTLLKVLAHYGSPVGLGGRCAGSRAAGVLGRSFPGPAFERAVAGRGAGEPGRALGSMGAAAH